MHDLDDPRIHPDVKALIDYYQFDTLPVEGTLYKSTYRARARTADGGPAGTAIIGLYADIPYSVSCFHKLRGDEVWHAYAGDPFVLVLLHHDGSTERVTMGRDITQGQRVQFTVPADTWQAGYLADGGRYALYGCTTAPGFRGQDFIAANADELVQQYPQEEALIRRLAVNGETIHMPPGFEED